MSGVRVGRPAGSQRGGLVILVAFLLLVLMAGAAFATSRNVVRELILGGDLARGAKAAAAAEGGTDWFLACPQGKAPDAPVRERFRIRVRPLGILAQAGMGRGGHPGGAQDPAALPEDQLWQVTVTGSHGDRDQVCRQIRELLVSGPAGADPVAPAQPEAWATPWGSP